MDDIFSLFYGIINNDYKTAEKVDRTEINGYIIDTCDTADCGWETAVWYKSNKMVIVQRYEDKDEATIGHEKWVEFCKGNPTEVWSVQLDEMCKLR